MKNIYRFILFLSFSQILLSFNRSTTDVQFGFIENKGQIVNQQYLKNNNVKFIASKSNIQLILNTNSFSYQLFKSKKINSPLAGTDYSNDETYFQFHRTDISFVDCNTKILIEPINRFDDYINYYNLKDAGDEYVSCNHFQSVRYKNVYDNIDFVFSPDKSRNGFKYDIILHPGANIADIKLKFEGQNRIELNAGLLSIHTSLGIINESIPQSFYENGEETEINFQLNNNILSFVGNYDNSRELTIDPLLNLGTYFGSSSIDIGLEICNDINDNTIITGFTNSISNIATTGAYQTEMKGDHDAFLVKFSSSGNRVWSTYYGGNHYDTGHGVASDEYGNIIMVGWTKSTSGISTNGSHQFFHSGGEFDSYIVKFNSDGQRQWATYYGGQQDDYINDIVTDGYSEIIIVGRTSSLVNIASANSFQESFGGSNDIFLAKFSANGVRRWGTYMGGAGFDVGMEVATDIFNNIAITGYTQSSDFIASPNAQKTHISGIWDAFVAKFDKDGNRLWSTYFGGPKEDNGRGIDIDGYGNIYITGNTFSEDSISTSGAYQETISSEESDAFIAKYGSNGYLSWATYYGGEDEDMGNVATISAWNQIAVAGNTLSSNGIATQNAFKNYNSGLSDVFVCTFDSDGQIEYGTFYGGDLNDYAHGLNYTRKHSSFVITGYTSSTSGIATTESFQTELAGESDAYLAKFSANPIIDSVFISSISGIWCADNSIRIPYTVDGSYTNNNRFIAQLSNAAGKFDEYFNIGEMLSNTSGTITANIPREALTSQKYRIRIVSTEPKTVSPDNGIDITIYELPNPKILGENVACTNKNYTYKSKTAENMAYRWEAVNGTVIGSNMKDTCNIVWDSVGVAYIKLIQMNAVTGCKDSITRQVSVYPEVKTVSLLGEERVCPNTEVLYYSSSDEYILNEWFVENGTIAGNISKDSILVKWNEAKEGTLTLKQTSVQSHCKDSVTKKVFLYDLPKPNIIGSTLVDAFKSYIYRTQPTSRYYIIWSVEGGQITTPEINNIIDVYWGGEGIGKLKLTLTDKETGCKDSLIYDIIIKVASSELITGDTLVCAFSNFTYSYSDTNYTKKWIANGGVINGSDSSDIIQVYWEGSGFANLTLIRTNKSNQIQDTLILSVKIQSTPEGTIVGENNSCELNSNLFYTDANPKFSRKWIAYNGNITGSDTKDSVLVFWDKIISQSDSVLQIGRVVLVLYDSANGCINNIQKNINVYRRPKVEITGESNVCRNTIYIYNTSREQNSQLNWTIEGGVITSNMGDTSIVIEWQSQNSGRLQLIETSVYGCSDTSSIKVTIYEQPEKPTISQINRELVSSSVSGNQWLLDDEEIPNAVEQKYLPLTSGYYSVQVTSDKGCKSEKSNPFYFDVNSVHNKNDQNSIGIYPNPVNEFVILKINSDIYEELNVQIVNLIGEVLINSEFKLEGNEVKVDLSKIVPGVYFIVLYHENIYKYKIRVVKL